MPMKPALPEKVPPIRKPTATRRPLASEASRAIASTLASTTATPAMIVYWRRRYAVAPSCTAVEMACISALPGESDSSQRDVTTPYATAAPAQTSAMITPQSVRKSKGYVLRLVMHDRASQRGRTEVVGLWPDHRHRPEQERAQSIEVLTKDVNDRPGRDRLAALHPDVVVGHERQVGVAELELPGQPGL